MKSVWSAQRKIWFFQRFTCTANYFFNFFIFEPLEEFFCKLLFFNYKIISFALKQCFFFTLQTLRAVNVNLDHFLKLLVFVKTCIWTVNHAFYSFIVYHRHCLYPAHMVLILFVQVLKKGLKSLKFELKNPAAMLLCSRRETAVILLFCKHHLLSESGFTETSGLLRRYVLSDMCYFSKQLDKTDQVPLTFSEENLRI